jgi:imidazolonepropionase-like amidohydrolase
VNAEAPCRLALAQPFYVAGMANRDERVRRDDNRPVATPDLLIRGGLVLGGTGAPVRPADVVVTADRITDVAPGLSPAARRVIDAAGRVVSPGFIDAKTRGVE